MSEDNRAKTIRKAISKLKEEKSSNGKYRVDIKGFFDGNEYYMFVYHQYKDVRLVGAPPESIGKFGGDTDNWMWPRHTGDFSMFRIYTAPDGSAATYSKNNIPFKGFAPDAVDTMKRYHWPGNVRELRNFVETAIILNKGEVVRSGYVLSSLNMQQQTMESENLPVPLNKTPDQAERELIYRTLISLKLDMTEVKEMLNRLMADRATTVMGNPAPASNENGNAVSPSTMSGMERQLIKETLEKYMGSRRKTARALQISERTLYRKINEYGL